MSEKLKEHLVSKGTDALAPLLGSQVVDLLMYLGDEAYAPEVMAQLIITTRGAAAVLREKQIRDILIAGLDLGDLKDLCAVLNLRTDVPRMTIAGVNFDMPNAEAAMFEWFNVPYDGDEQPDDFSRNVGSSERLSTHQEPAYRTLRAHLSKGESKVLIHMPFGAGKLRTVATAVLEAFRSEAEGKSVLWLAPEECLCDEAIVELETVWHQLGLRDVTAYRLFGGRRLSPLGPVNNAIVVADAREMAEAMFAVGDIDNSVDRDVALQTLRQFGSCVRHVVLADAEHIMLPGMKAILAALAYSGEWNLVGISASPSLAIRANIDPDELLSAYGRNVIEVMAEDPLDALRQTGEVDPIDVIEVHSPIGELEVSDDWMALPAATARNIAQDVNRNKMLIDRLHDLAQQAERIVYYATTAEQARMFAGLLELKGTAASALTSEMEESGRAQELVKFNVDGNKQVLCVHGLLVSSDQAHRITSVVLGLPAPSGSMIHEMVGRLATGRRAPHTPLKVHAVTDPVPGFIRVVNRLNEWDRLAV